MLKDKDKRDDFLHQLSTKIVVDSHPNSEISETEKLRRKLKTL